jgi:hypothetical protein
VIAYLQLIEMDRLNDSQAIDRMYHGAKLTAAAFGEPERIWQEHEQVRAALLRAPAEAPGPPPLDVMALHRRLVDLGLVPPRSGEMH